MTLIADYVSNICINMLLSVRIAMAERGWASGRRYLWCLFALSRKEFEETLSTLRQFWWTVVSFWRSWFKVSPKLFSTICKMMYCLKISIMRNIMPHGLLKVSWHFGWSCRFHVEILAISQARNQHGTGSKQSNWLAKILVYTWNLKRNVLG
jgi:hypothetical protein